MSRRSPEPSDTIAAISTALGEAGIAVVRVSGPGAVGSAQGVLRFGGTGGFPPPREMRLAVLLDEGGSAIDRVLAVRFAAPGSYTGEDVVEIQTHGGTLVARRCLDLLLRRGVRVAEPGEFTRRAFLNGRIDLSQAEAVLGVIRARSDEALRAAARTLTGELSREARRIRDGLLELQGTLEAGLDFPEEEIPLMDEAAFLHALDGLKSDLAELEGRCAAGALLREGLKVALAGRPNAGKSSLLNALLGRERAIVTEEPGTTRDLIEETLLLQGVPVLLVDTAGLRESGGIVEKLGMERARQAMEDADLCLWLVDGACPLTEKERGDLASLREEKSAVVLTKADLPRAVTEDAVRAALPSPAMPVLFLSARTGEGLDALREKIVSLASGEAGGTLNAGLNVTARQLEDIRAALRAVVEAQEALRNRMGEDVTASALGQARQALERLLGMECGDALLDSIFSRFCVGK